MFKIANRRHSLLPIFLTFVLLLFSSGCENDPSVNDTPSNALSQNQTSTNTEESNSSNDLSANATTNTTSPLSPESSGTEDLLHLDNDTDLSEKPDYNTETDAVMFVHGFNSSSKTWKDMISGMKDKSINNVFTIDLPERGVRISITKQAQFLEEHMVSITQKGFTRIHLIAHSMGGLVCREYLRIRKTKSAKIPNLVTIGTPNHGIGVKTGITEVVTAETPTIQMLPGSRFLEQLENQGPIDKTKVTCLWSKKDEVIIPYSSAILSWANNKEFPGLRHCELPDDSKVIEYVINILKNTQ